MRSGTPDLFLTGHSQPVNTPFSVSLTGICKQVRVLERAGRVRRTREGRENTLELSAEPLREVARWISQYEQFWNTRLNRLEKFFTSKLEKAK
jgi:hypothetical protein